MLSSTTSAALATLMLSPPEMAPRPSALSSAAFSTARPASREPMATWCPARAQRMARPRPSLPVPPTMAIRMHRLLEKGPTLRRGELGDESHRLGLLHADDERAHLGGLPHLHALLDALGGSDQVQQVDQLVGHRGDRFLAL